MRPYHPTTSLFPMNQPIQSVTSLFKYTGRASQVIARLKYSKITSLAHPLSSLLYLTAEHEGLLETDIIIPVPIHRYRRIERGYNQAELLCSAFPLKYKDIVRPSHLKKKIHTPPQASVKKSNRNPKMMNPYISTTQVNNKNILIIDDVYTTGQTVSWCAEALKKAGAKEIHVLTLARS